MVRIIGCTFCATTGCVSAVNQHVRSYHQSYKQGRKSRLRDFHPLEISRAFEHLINYQADLVNEVSPERLTVLSVFASLATQELHCDDDIEKWEKRHYALHGADWWETNIAAAIAVFRAARNNMDALKAHVQQIVVQAKHESLAGIRRDARPLHRNPPAVENTRVVNISASPASTLNVQGDESKNLSESGNRNIASSRGIAKDCKYIYISDSSDEDALYAPPPARAVRSVSAGPSFSTPARLIKPATFLFMKLTGIARGVTTVEIAYGTTLGEALAAALQASPEWVRQLGREVCFEALDGTDWDEGRWDDMMKEGEKRVITVELRLVFRD